MPTYEAEDHLRECIDSIRSQTFEYFELIVVDDGSSDKTVPIVESYDDNRIQVIHRDGEIGIPSARNCGLKHANGEYIACHDADDRSHPDRLKHQVEFLESHDDVAAIGTGAKLINEKGEKIARRRVLEKPTITDLLEKNHFIHGSVIFRRSVMDEIGGYDERFTTSEDYELLLRLANKYAIRNIDKQLYELRIRQNSVYASQLEQMVLFGQLARKKAARNSEWALLMRDVDKKGIYAVYDQMSTNKKLAYHQVIARESLRYGRLKDAKMHAKRAIELRKPNLYNSLLFLLTLTSPAITKQIASTYRKIIINPLIIFANYQNNAIRSCT